MRLLSSRATSRGKVQKRSASPTQRPECCPRGASPPTPPARSPSVDSEADVAPTLRQSVIQRSRDIMRHWGSSQPGPAPRAATASLGPADFAALAVRHSGSRRGASFSLLASGALPSPASEDSEASDCEPPEPLLGQRQSHAPPLEQLRAPTRVDFNEACEVALATAASSHAARSDLGEARNETGCFAPAPSVSCDQTCNFRQSTKDDDCSTDEAIVLPPRVLKRRRSKR